MSVLDNKVVVGVKDRSSNFNAPVHSGSLSESKNETPSLTIMKAHGAVLDHEKWQQRLANLQTFRQQARIQQANNRMEMAIDEDFYDSIQMSIEDINVLQERRQPILTFNVIKDTINWLLGTEKKIRVDFNITPRNKGDEEAQDAKLKTEIFKFDSDINHSEYVISNAFASAVKAGVGWVDVGARNQEDSPIYIRNEKWRNVWFDHLSVGLMRKMSRFVIREKWIDLDIAQTMFEDRAEDLKTLSAHVNALYPYNPDDIILSDPASEFDVEGQLDSMFSPRGETLRERVRIVECQYRMPAKVKILRLVDKSIPWGSLDGTVYRKGNADQDYLVNNGYFNTTESLKMIVRMAYWCGNVYLKDILSPYNHWEFTLIPIWCYVRERDNMPYGVIRDLRDPQIDLNKRRSRALFLMASNQIIAEKGATDNKQETMNEASRPDGYIEYNVGKKLEFVKNLDLSQAHLNMAHDDERFIHSIAGHVDPQVAESKKEISGTALTSLKEGTQITSGVLFDNYYFGLQLIGEVRLALIEQFHDAEEEIITGTDKNKPEFKSINKPQDDGTILNPITKAKARFIIGKRDYRESVRASMLSTLTEITMYLTKTAPQVAIAMLDLVVEFMDDLGPLKSDLVARIRKINKQHAPFSEMNPDEQKQAQQADQKKEQQEQMMQMINMKLLEAKLKVTEGKASTESSKAIKDKVDSTVKELEGYLKALEVASGIQMNPAIAEAADEIIKESKKLGADNEDAQDDQGQGSQRQIASPQQIDQTQQPQQGNLPNQGGM
jgi:hypothetical protein